MHASQEGTYRVLGPVVAKGLHRHLDVRPVGALLYCHAASHAHNVPNHTVRRHANNNHLVTEAPQGRRWPWRGGVCGGTRGASLATWATDDARRAARGLCLSFVLWQFVACNARKGCVAYRDREPGFVRAVARVPAHAAVRAHNNRKRQQTRACTTWGRRCALHAPERAAQALAAFATAAARHGRGGGWLRTSASAARRSRRTRRGTRLRHNRPTHAAELAQRTSESQRRACGCRA